MSDGVNISAAFNASAFEGRGRVDMDSSLLVRKMSSKPVIDHRLRVGDGYVLPDILQTEIYSGEYWCHYS